MITVAGNMREPNQANQEKHAVKYKVVLRQSEGGFSVSCSGLPGYWLQGKTEEEALANIREAIREYLEAGDIV